MFRLFSKIGFFLFLIWIAFAGNLISAVTTTAKITLQDAAKNPDLADKYWAERGVSRELQAEVAEFISRNGKASQDEMMKRGVIYYTEFVRDYDLLEKNPAAAWTNALKAARKIVKE
jgi:hypothetical protein